MSNIDITQIKLNVTFGPAGGDSRKNLTFYKATKNSISGSIASIRGDSIGAVSVEYAYDRSVTLTFSAGSNAAIFSTLKAYFMAGSRVLIIYVPTTRGTYSGGYCYDYLSVVAATLTLDYQYLQSDGSLSSTSVAAGSSATLNISAYNSAYSHKVTWTFGHTRRRRPLLRARLPPVIPFRCHGWTRFPLRPPVQQASPLRRWMQAAIRWAAPATASRSQCLPAWCRPSPVSPHPR